MLIEVPPTNQILGVGYDVSVNHDHLSGACGDILVVSARCSRYGNENSLGLLRGIQLEGISGCGNWSKLIHACTNDRQIGCIKSAYVNWSSNVIPKNQRNRHGHGKRGAVHRGKVGNSAKISETISEGIVYLLVRKDPSVKPKIVNPSIEQTSAISGSSNPKKPILHVNGIGLNGFRN